MWTYLNTPFLYTTTGFTTEEIAPIDVDGETWRRLKVTFPEHIKTHTREQFSCFGLDGLLRRHDFTIDILGGAPGQLYATDYRERRRHHHPDHAAAPGKATTTFPRF